MALDQRHAVVGPVPAVTHDFGLGDEKQRDAPEQGVFHQRREIEPDRRPEIERVFGAFESQLEDVHRMDVGACFGGGKRCRAEDEGRCSAQ